MLPTAASRKIPVNTGARLELLAELLVSLLELSALLELSLELASLLVSELLVSELLVSELLVSELVETSLLELSLVLLEACSLCTELLATTEALLEARLLAVLEARLLDAGALLTAAELADDFG